MGIRNFSAITIGNGTGLRSFMNQPRVQNLSSLTTESGGVPKFVYVAAMPGVLAGNVIYVTPALTGGANAIESFAISCDGPGNSVIINVHGFDRLAFHHAGDGTSYVQCVPLEDF